MQSRFPRGLVAVLSVLSILFGLTAVASADDVSNNLDNSVDATAEVMSLNAGGPNGTTTLYIVERNGDGKNGCNLTGQTTLTISVSSSNQAVATVSPASATFTSCGDTKVLTVTPASAGQATISAALVSNTTDGSFNLAPVTFTVNVAPAPPSNTAPSVSVAGVTGGASYPLGSVPAATCDVTDAEDGPSSFAATLSAITGPDAANGIGSQTATCSYTDAGGLNATSSVTYSIVDVTAPVITSILSPASPNGDNGWYTSDVTLDWTVTEAESTSTLVTSGCDSTSVTADQQSVDYTCSAQSDGGSDTATESIKRDATKPTIGAVLSPAANGNGWNNSNVTVTYSCDDATSGVAGCGPNQTLSDEGLAVAYSGTATDNAGNTEMTGGTVKIDKTAPVVTVTGVGNGAQYTLGSVPTAGCSTTDALSGVATQASVASSGGPVGSVTATCSGGVDNAGNAAWASVTYSVIFAWDGFRQPVDNLPTLNRAKAGSAIPLKFSLSGNQGLNIFAAGYPSSKTVACGSTAEADIIEETVTAGSSSLSYDATADQYIYVWKTDKGWANTCRTLTVKLVDGTIHQANFTFTK